MYNHALNAYHECKKSSTVNTIVPEAEEKLMGLLPLTWFDALTLKKLIAPAETLEEFYRQEAGECVPFTDEALKAGFSASWDGVGGDAFSALYMAICEYADYHTGGEVKAKFRAKGLSGEYWIGFMRFLLVVLGAGRALGMHEAMERHKENKDSYIARPRYTARAGYYTEKYQVLSR